MEKSLVKHTILQKFKDNKPMSNYRKGLHLVWPQQPLLEQTSDSEWKFETGVPLQEAELQFLKYYSIQQHTTALRTI